MNCSSITDRLSTTGLRMIRGIRIPGALVQQPSLPLLPLFIGLIPLPDPSVPPGDGCTGSIAPFAARNHYRETVHGLQQCVKDLCAAYMLNKRDFRVFSNSRLPERSLAAAAGLGWVGRNGLLMNRTYGSSFILAGLMLSSPRSIELLRDAKTLPDIDSLAPPEEPYSACGACRACEQSCPSGAINSGGGIATSRCLQSLATSTNPLPEFARAVWGTRIYGCSECQLACPVNRSRSFHAPQLPTGDEFRPLTPLLEMLSGTTEPGLRQLFPATALEAGWIPRDAILRNIITAAGNCQNRDRLLPLLQKLATPEGPGASALPPLLLEAAHAALWKIQAAAAE